MVSPCTFFILSITIQLLGIAHSESRGFLKVHNVSQSIGHEFVNSDKQNATHSLQVEVEANESSASSESQLASVDDYLEYDGEKTELLPDASGMNDASPPLDEDGNVEYDDDEGASDAASHESIMSEDQNATHTKLAAIATQNATQNVSTNIHKAVGAETFFEPDDLAVDDDYVEDESELQVDNDPEALPDDSGIDDASPPIEDVSPDRAEA